MSLILHDMGELAHATHNALPTPRQLHTAQLPTPRLHLTIILFGSGIILVPVRRDDGVRHFLVDVFPTADELGVLDGGGGYETFGFGFFGPVKEGLVESVTRCTGAKTKGLTAKKPVPPCFGSSAGSVGAEVVFGFASGWRRAGVVCNARKGGCVPVAERSRPGRERTGRVIVSVTPVCLRGGREIQCDEKVSVTTPDRAPQTKSTCQIV